MNINIIRAQKCRAAFQKAKQNLPGLPADPRADYFRQEYLALLKMGGMVFDDKTREGVIEYLFELCENN